jgi:hypothetical protein
MGVVMWGQRRQSVRSPAERFAWEGLHVQEQALEPRLLDQLLAGFLAVQPDRLHKGSVRHRPLRPHEPALAAALGRVLCDASVRGLLAHLTGQHEWVMLNAQVGRPQPRHPAGFAGGGSVRRWGDRVLSLWIPLEDPPLGRFHGLSFVAGSHVLQIEEAGLPERLLRERIQAFMDAHPEAWVQPAWSKGMLVATQGRLLRRLDMAHAGQPTWLKVDCLPRAHWPTSERLLDQGGLDWAADPQASCPWARHTWVQRLTGVHP